MRLVVLLLFPLFLIRCSNEEEDLGQSGDTKDTQQAKGGDSSNFSNTNPLINKINEMKRMKHYPNDNSGFTVWFTEKEGDIRCEITTGGSEPPAEVGLKGGSTKKYLVDSFAIVNGDTLFIVDPAKLGEAYYKNFEFRKYEPDSAKTSLEAITPLARRYWVRSDSNWVPARK